MKKISILLVVLLLFSCATKIQEVDGSLYDFYSFDKDDLETFKKSVNCNVKFIDFAYGKDFQDNLYSEIYIGDFIVKLLDESTQKIFYVVLSKEYFEEFKNMIPLSDLKIELQWERHGAGYIYFVPTYYRYEVCVNKLEVIKSGLENFEAPEIEKLNVSYSKLVFDVLENPKDYMNNIIDCDMYLLSIQSATSSNSGFLETEKNQEFYTFFAQNLLKNNSVELKIEKDKFRILLDIPLGSKIKVYGKLRYFLKHNFTITNLKIYNSRLDFYKIYFVANNVVPIK